MSYVHPADEEALQSIDAAVFTGDPSLIRERLEYFMERWQKVFAGLDADEISQPTGDQNDDPQRLHEDRPTGEDRETEAPSQAPEQEGCGE